MWTACEALKSNHTKSMHSAKNVRKGIPKVLHSNWSTLIDTSPVYEQNGCNGPHPILFSSYTKFVVTAIYCKMGLRCCKEWFSSELASKQDNIVLCCESCYFIFPVSLSISKPVHFVPNSNNMKLAWTFCICGSGLQVFQKLVFFDNGSSSGFQQRWFGLFNILKTWVGRNTNRRKSRKMWFWNNSL